MKRVTEVEALLKQAPFGLLKLEALDFGAGKRSLGLARAGHSEPRGRRLPSLGRPL